MGDPVHPSKQHIIILAVTGRVSGAAISQILTVFVVGPFKSIYPISRRAFIAPHWNRKEISLYLCHRNGQNRRESAMRGIAMVARKKPARSTAKSKPEKKQAVIVIHGMGEPVPMRTLRSFVNAVWVTDDSLISRNRPNSNDGLQRVDNPVWFKPDSRNRSFELRRITTEQSDQGQRTDFYEFYWAHLMYGTTWEHLKAWISDLLIRTPRRVPPNVFGAWIALWIITLLVAAGFLYSLLPISDLRQCLAADCEGASCDAANPCWTWVLPVIGAVISLAVGAFVNTALLKYFGDVARYVKASPVNVARRQEIREKGVELLETLMGIRDFDPRTFDPSDPAREWDTDYDRIVVVGHSLGAVIAYDILNFSFARVNRLMSKGSGKQKQPYRHQLEQLIQNAIEQSGSLDLEEFRRLQHLSWKELKDQGSPWIVSDFITVGSPLTHAEFLLAESEEDLRLQQEERILPTCPPTLEWDARTKHQHFSYRPGAATRGGPVSGESFRYPHHAAQFAFTRWTNLYSQSRGILWGDIISGPVADHFDLSTPVARLQGIRDIAVLPERDFEGQPSGKVPFFTHTKYWDMNLRTGPNDSWAVPYHIHQLRQTLNLLDE